MRLKYFRNTSKRKWWSITYMARRRTTAAIARIFDMWKTGFKVCFSKPRALR